MYLIRVKGDFCAAHALRFTDGTAEPLHGHNWRVETVIECPSLDESGIGIDFLEINDRLQTLLDSQLDHQNLNMIDGLNSPNPTSENLARWIADALAQSVSRDITGARLRSVTVWETDDFGVTYEL
jgi:6-pyruvoyltetrahydropterin/6-carboxytetrahydropterin synthase